MNLKRTAAVLVTAGALVGGVGGGAASANPGGPGDAGRVPAGVVRAGRQFDCSKLAHFTSLEGRLKQNIQDRISILTDLQSTVGSRRAARVQKQIDRLKGEITKLDKGLTKVTQRCSSTPTGPTATAGTPIPQ
jgi:hypothetical protein